MDDNLWLAERFEANRPHLRAVAYRMLGSVTEADDAVQEAWLRLARSDADSIEDLTGWLITVVGRVCLNMLRTRTSRREEPLDAHLPDPIVSPVDSADPEYEALLADSVGLALLVVLERLTPAERLAFVLHDMFDMPFDAIAPLVGRSTTAVRQLASRARRRVRTEVTPDPDTDIGAQRKVVDAFFAAARSGDFEGLVAVLHPGIVLRFDGGDARRDASGTLRGSAAVAEQALTYARLTPHIHSALVNGAPGAVVALHGRPFSIMSFTIRRGKITDIHILADPARLRHVDLTVLDS